MRKRTGAAAAACIIAFMSVCFPAQIVYADTMLQLTQDGYVYNFEDLQERLHEGGEATLGASITIPHGKSLSLGRGSIHTGSYGILVEGQLVLSPGSAITGEGTALPVIEVLSDGRLYSTSSDEACSITATGDNGRALVLRSGSGFSQNSIISIRANGADAIAIESEIDFDIWRGRIEAKNGIGIVCNGEVQLLLCKITAGTASVQAQSFTADTCFLSPAPSGGTVIDRKISGLSRTDELIALGDPLPDYAGNPLSVTATLHADGYEDIFESLYVVPVVSDIDIYTPGIYPVGIQLEEWLNGFGLVSETAELFQIEIRDASIPGFTDAGYFFGMYYIDFWYKGVDASALTLWRSDDEGQSWYDHTAEVEMLFHEGTLSIFFDEMPEHPVWFVWEVAGLGESHILCVTVDNSMLGNGDLIIGYGGDRTGGDHGANTLPPPTLPGGGIPTTPDDDPPITPGDDPSATPDAGMETTWPTTAPDGETSTIPPVMMPDEETQITPPTSDDEMLQSAQITSALTPLPIKPAEYSDGNSITVSGARLGVMIAANPNHVSFMRGELRVSLPTAFLKDLDDIDTFTVTLYQPTEQSFAVSFAVNQKELTQRWEEPFMISLPWRAGAVSCVSENGESIGAALDGKRATFLLHETGVYTMTEPIVPAVAITDTTPLNGDSGMGTTEPVPPQNDETTETQKPHSDSVLPVVIVGSVSALCAGAYLWFSRIRRVKLH